MAQSTFYITAGADDGQVTATGASYPPGGTPSAVTDNAYDSVQRDLVAGPTYTNTVGILRFDTSALPADATVTGATLNLYCVANNSADTRNLVMEWYASGSIGSEDYTATASDTAHAGTSINSLRSGGDKWEAFTLQNLENISLAGYTEVRLHVSGGEPTGENYASWRTYDYTTLIPYLVVDYTMPSVGVLRTARSSLRW